jgi:hypothetical protein
LKLKLILILIASCISNIQAAPFTFADITNPAKKACADAACVLSNHPGKLALTGFALGSVMYTLADREYSEVNRKAKKLDALHDTVLTPGSHFDEADYQDRSEKLQKAIKEYAEAQKDFRDLENELLRSATNRYEYSKSLAKALSEGDMKQLRENFKQTSPGAFPTPEEAVKELKDKKASSPELKEAEARLEESKKALRESFGQEIKNLNTQALQNYYNNFRYFGAFIALASAAGYGTYKAFPYLRKWLATYYAK